MCKNDKKIGGRVGGSSLVRLGSERQVLEGGRNASPFPDWDSLCLFLIGSG